MHAYKLTLNKLMNLSKETLCTKQKSAIYGRSKTNLKMTLMKKIKFFSSYFM